MFVDAWMINLDPRTFSEIGAGKRLLASAAHMTPTISGCRNMLISVVFVNVYMNNKSTMLFLTFHAVNLALQQITCHKSNLLRAGRIILNCIQDIEPECTKQ